MTVLADSLGAQVQRVLQSNAVAMVDPPLLSEAGLGYPLHAENKWVVSWRGRSAFEAWCEKHRIKPRPLRVTETRVTFIKLG